MGLSLLSLLSLVRSGGKVEDDFVDLAKELMQKADAKGSKFLLPEDVVIADKVGLPTCSPLLLSPPGLHMLGVQESNVGAVEPRGRQSSVALPLVLSCTGGDGIILSIPQSDGMRFVRDD